MQMALDAVIKQATQHLQAGSFGLAEPLIAEALPQRPNNAELWHLLGVLKHQTGKTDEAVTAFSRAISLNGGVPEYHNNLGESLRVSGREDEAIAAYQNAIRLRDGFAQARVNLGMILLSLNRLQEAAAAYHGAIRVDPYQPAAHDGLGKSLGLGGDHAAAADAFRNAVELEPTNPQYWFDWALAEQNLGQFDEAAWRYRRALAIRPDYAEANNNLTNCLAAQATQRR